MINLCSYICDSYGDVNYLYLKNRYHERGEEKQEIHLFNGFIISLILTITIQLIYLTLLVNYFLIINSNVMV